jgi:aryl-alcohol dehydrogenase-like predicted oxidoreductase|tara:strand:- start:208 stop:1206 length:999 start_codon:yes stop_codon:yes gene_type:complete
MNYRELGKTGIKVSEIGFGAWGIGGQSLNAPGYGDVEDNESLKALRFAYEKGVTFYDTADLYGDGHSERIIAKAFDGLRKKIIIASKGGTLPHTGLYMPQDFSARHLNKALDQSLKRLKTDYIDIYQLHSPKIEDIEENECIETLNCFKNTGKIKEFGVSVRSPLDAKYLIENYDVPFVQINLNLIDQRLITEGVMKAAEEKKTGLIIRTPLVFGFLTGSLDKKTKFKEDDHRSNYPKEQLTIWSNASKFFHFLHKDKTVAQAALRYCLDFEAVSTVIPGMLNVEEVKENLIASDLTPFSSEEHKLITEVYEQNQSDFFTSSLKGAKDKQDV